jgi:hypothetical protein
MTLLRHSRRRAGLGARMAFLPHRRKHGYSVAGRTCFSKLVACRELQVLSIGACPWEVYVKAALPKSSFVSVVLQPLAHFASVALSTQVHSFNALAALLYILTELISHF